MYKSVYVLVHKFSSLSWHVTITLFQELRGDVWVFKDKAITFANDVLIGGPQEFMQWAEDEHNYTNFRPLQLFTTLAEEAYKTHLNSRKVRIKHRHHCQLQLQMCHVFKITHISL